jgi:Domain of unknown function (DU1801)
MVSSKETTPSGYLASLPADRRAVIAAVRKVIRANLPEGYVESMNWGMLSYEVPLKRYLCYIGLAAQKNNFAVYLMNVYADPKRFARLKAWYDANGKRFDMGKCCLRFKRLDDIPLDIVGEIVASTPVDELIAITEKAHPKR